MFSAKIRTAQPLLAYTNIPLRKHQEMRKRPLHILLKVSPGCLCFMNENKYRYISQTRRGILYTSETTARSTVRDGKG